MLRNVISRARGAVGARVAARAAPAASRSRPLSSEVEAFAYNTPYFLRAQPESLKWNELGFNIRTMNGHVRYTWEDGEWDTGSFVPSPYELLHINAGALHYGIAAFEGLKAFAGADGTVRVCNPALNAKRMARGADRLLMPEVPEDLFLTAVAEAVRRNVEFVPPHGAPASLYIRPLLFASGPMLGLAPLAKKFTFFVTVTPCGSYFSASKGTEAGVTALVSEAYDRAAPMGTGGVKAAGNYAADLKPVHGCNALGYNTTLYLDSRERKYVEEFSVCNFVGVTHAGVYVTPKSDTILASTTNRMLMELARARGIPVEERAVDFDAEIESFKEVGMCGTAAVVVKVAAITRDKKKYEFPDFDTIGQLRADLIAIQTGDVKDTRGWMLDACKTDGTACAPAGSAIAERAALIETAEARGEVQRTGSEAMHGQERRLLQHVVAHATPGDADSVLAAMDGFWAKTFPQSADASGRWNMRGQLIEQRLLNTIEAKKKKDPTSPAQCVELGTYCGYSAVRIARNLPAGATLLSVEKDELFAAIATKIVEFAGLEQKVKIWIGTVHTEGKAITERLKDLPCDFLLVDHSKDAYLPDLRLLESLNVIDASTAVVGDVEVYPGDKVEASRAQRRLDEQIEKYFDEHNNFRLLNMV
ncbi:aminotransferase [Pelagophyceae sp. CCMP2097]|nr:aminotransferase [Pelagophyceae sp. CCMP2097]